MGLAQAPVTNQSASYRTIYGNPQILPLIGGSGAGSQGNDNSGSAGGGAILIAATETVTINGLISAQNGSAGPKFGADVGAGGAIKIIADQVLGTGELNAIRDGRVRIETSLLATTLITQPESIAVPPSSPPTIFPAANSPTVRIVSVDGVDSPNDPSAPLEASADIPIQNNGTLTVIMETTNFPIEGVVQLRIAEKFGNSRLLTASYTSGDLNSALWTVQTTLEDGFNTLQARATSP